MASAVFHKESGTARLLRNLILKVILVSDLVSQFQTEIVVNLTVSVLVRWLNSIPGYETVIG